MKDNIKRRPKLLKFLNPQNIATEIHRCGYNFTISSYLKYLLIVYLGIAALAYFYKLHMIAIFIILGIATLFLPIVFLNKYRSLYEHKKFDDLVNYMEQMLYSFKKNNKILTSLQDTLALFPKGEMHDDIVKAIEYIKTSHTTGDIYREAFSFIEEDFGCKRLYTLHNFLAKVEYTGGNFDSSIDILLSDRILWTDRVYELERDKKNVMTKVTLGIGISFLVGLLAVYIIPESMDVTSKSASQIVTTLIFLCNMLIWYISNKKLSGSLINDKNDATWEEIKSYYNLVFHGNLKKKKRTCLIIGMLFVPISIYLFFAFNTYVGIISLILVYVIVSQPNRQHKLAYKKIKTEVEKAFPDWLLNMSLLLQTDNVHVALSKSINDAPEILKEELRKLEKGISEYPNSVEPYINFMDILNISDVMSAMKMLYSMAEYGSKDISKQIDSLVKRNSTMMDKADRLRAEDYLAIMGFFVLMPMITGVFKLVVDMALIVFYMLSLVTM